MAGQIKLSTQFHNGLIHKRHNWGKKGGLGGYYYYYYSVRREKLLEIVSTVLVYQNEYWNFGTTNKTSIIFTQICTQFESDFCVLVTAIRNKRLLGQQ